MGFRLGILERVSITGKTDRDIGFRKTGLCYEYHIEFEIFMFFIFPYLCLLLVFCFFFFCGCVHGQDLVKEMQDELGSWIVDS